MKFLSILLLVFTVALSSVSYSHADVIDDGVEYSVDQPTAQYATINIVAFEAEVTGIFELVTFGDTPMHGYYAHLVPDTLEGHYRPLVDPPDVSILTCD